MEQSTRQSLNSFKKKSFLSFEDKQALKDFLKALREFRFTSAIKTAYWWFSRESWRFSPMRYYEKHYQRHFDIRHNTDTLTRMELPKLTVKGDNLEHGVYYQCSPILHVRRLIKRLKIDYRDYVFVDFGSGKGAVLLVASEFPFQEIVGIEFSQELHETAQKIIQSYKPRKCQNVKSLNLDAVEYSFPDENLVLYFYNPFDTYILQKIAHNLEVACQRHSRKIYIIYHYCADLKILEQIPGMRVMTRKRKTVILTNQ